MTASGSQHQLPPATGSYCCVTIFGEQMTFRTMPETAVGNSADTLTNYHPETIPDLPTSDEEDGGEAEPRHGFSCPETWCAQHHRLYEKRYMIRQHLRRVHEYDREALDAYDRASMPAGAKPSIEIHETQELANAEVEATNKQKDEMQPLGAAVEDDGFMMPVDVFLGRGTDTRDRKRRALPRGKERKT